MNEKPKYFETPYRIARAVCLSVVLNLFCKFFSTSDSEESLDFVFPEIVQFLLSVKTKRYRRTVLIFILVFSPCPTFSANADVNEVAQELKTFRELEQQDDQEERSAMFEILDVEIWLHGLIEFNYEYLDVSDIDDDKSGSSSNFFIGSVELALRILFTEWSEAHVVGSAEDIGQNDGDEEIRLDEAVVSLKNLRVPVYFVGGKTVMPFGVFKDRLIEGTLTEDVYEIDQWGATFGFATSFRSLNASVSVYNNPEVIENLQNFDTHEFRSDRQKDDKFRSYVVVVSLEPVEDMLTVGVSYDSEPGDGRRNRSAGGALTLEVWKFSLDTEYITALTREKGANEAENKESAWVVGLAVDILDALELATRYELFDDDQRGDQDEVLDYRLLGGFNYEFCDYAMFSFEYRFSRYEKEKDSDATDLQNMFQFQLSLEF